MEVCIVFFFLFVAVVVVVVVFSLIVTHFICNITMIDSYHGALYLIFECLCVRVRERERQKERERERERERKIERNCKREGK